MSLVPVHVGFSLSLLVFWPVVHSSSPHYYFRWQDIVIGAPQYFDRSGEVGGAAYVYINQQGRWNNVKPIRLNGTKDSMFGIAVKNIGDINQDGYPGREIDCEMVMIYRLCDCLK